MDTEKTEMLRRVLRENGYSMTKSRLVVCDLLWGQEPLSMRELGERTKGKLDRASVYRTINLFERLGLVERIYIGWKYKVELSDIFLHHHHHISCLECGKVTALGDEREIETMIDQLAKRYGFTAQNHQLEVRGYCQSCTRKRETEV